MATSKVIRETEEAMDEMLGGFEDRDLALDRIVHKGLSQAKLAVMRECRYLLKTKPNSGGLKYSYAAEEQLIQLLHPAMEKHGLVISPNETANLVLHERYDSKGGGSLFKAVIEKGFTLKHVESGEEERITVFGEAADSGDKAMAKAQTIAYKYALRQTFMIQTGDDPDRFNPPEGLSKSFDDLMKRRTLMIMQETDRSKLDGYKAKINADTRLDGEARDYLNRLIDTRAAGIDGGKKA